jgi:hypothetical protein
MVDLMALAMGFGTFVYGLGPLLFAHKFVKN